MEVPSASRLKAPRGCKGEIESVLVAGTFDVVLLDMNFVAGERSGAAGLDALARIRAADPTLVVVPMTAYGGVTLAVESLKRGAADFVLKPWRNEILAAAVCSAVEVTVTRYQHRVVFDANL